MSIIGEAFIRIAPETKGFEAGVKSAVDPALNTAQKSVESTMKSVGTSMTKIVTPIATGIGLAFRQAFQEFDSGIDAIRTGTGATGAELKNLEGSMKAVAGTVTVGMGEVGKTMADVAQRTDLAGKPLENLTRQLINLQEIGNEASVETVTRAFGDWSIATEDQSAALDRLFRASQLTGPSVDRIGQLIVQYGAPLRELGFSFDEAATLMGKFEKEGVNTELAMGGLRIALGKIAREGGDPAKTLDDIVNSIKDAGSAGEANAIALEAFGARAGPDLARAIQEGRFALGDMLDQVKNGKDTIEKATKDARDWGDQIQILGNRLVGVIGPFGEFGFAISGILAIAGPAFVGIGKLIGVIKRQRDVTILSTIATKAKVVWDGLAAAAAWGYATAQTAVNIAMKANPFVKIISLIILVAGALVLAWKKSEKFREIVKDAWNKVKDAAAALWEGIKWPFEKIADIQRWVQDKVEDAVAAIKDKWQGFIDFFKKLPGRISEFSKNLWDGIRNSFIDVINWIIDKWNNLEFKLPSILGGGTIGLPDIPKLEHVGQRGTNESAPSRAASTASSAPAINVQTTTHIDGRKIQESNRRRQILLGGG